MTVDAYITIAQLKILPPIAVVGIVFMVLAGRFLLPKDGGGKEEAPARKFYRAEFEVHGNIQAHW